MGRAPKKSDEKQRARGRRMASSVERTLLNPSRLDACERGAGGQGASLSGRGRRAGAKTGRVFWGAPQKSRSAPMAEAKKSVRGFCGRIDLRDSNRGWYNVAKGPTDGPADSKALEFRGKLARATAGSPSHFGSSPSEEKHKRRPRSRCAPCASNSSLHRLSPVAPCGRGPGRGGNHAARRPAFSHRTGTSVASCVK